MAQKTTPWVSYIPTEERFADGIKEVMSRWLFAWKLTSLFRCWCQTSFLPKREHSIIRHFLAKFKNVRLLKYVRVMIRGIFHFSFNKGQNNLIEMFKNANCLFPQSYLNISRSFDSDMRNLSVLCALCNNVVSFNHRRSFFSCGIGAKCPGFGSNLEEPIPQNTLLHSACWISFTDFSTGLITQPVYVAAKRIQLKAFESRNF